jgi:hypothetical protein
MKENILLKNLLNVSNIPPAKSEKYEAVKFVKSSKEMVGGISGKTLLAVLYKLFCIGSNTSDVLIVSGSEFKAFTDCFNKGGIAKKKNDTNMTISNK